MGCTKEGSINFNPEANTDDGYCYNYVSGGTIRRVGGATFDPDDISENSRTLGQGSEPHRCKGKSGNELMKCASDELKVCKDICDKNDWCTGIYTNLNNRDNSVKNNGHPLYCDFTKDGEDEISILQTKPNNNSIVGYIKSYS